MDVTQILHVLTCCHNSLRQTINSRKSSSRCSGSSPHQWWGVCWQTSVVTRTFTWHGNSPLTTISSSGLTSSPVFMFRQIAAKIGSDAGGPPMINPTPGDAGFPYPVAQKRQLEDAGNRHSSAHPSRHPPQKNLAVGLVIWACQCRYGTSLLGFTVWTEELVVCKLVIVILKVSCDDFCPFLSLMSSNELTFTDAQYVAAAMKCSCLTGTHFTSSRKTAVDTM